MRGSFLQANAAFQQASVPMTNLGYDETQKAVKLFNDWALILSHAGLPLAAAKAYRRAIDITRSNQTEDVVSPTLLYNYSLVLHELGRLKEAADYAERAQAKAEKAVDLLLVDQITLQRARIYRDLGDLKRASAMLVEVEPRRRNKLPPGHFAFAIVTSDKALLAQGEEHLSAAVQLANEAVTIDEMAIQGGGQGVVYLPILLFRRSAVELEAQQPDLAGSDAARALDLLHSTAQSGMLSSNMGLAYLALARALQAQGKDDQARANFRLAVEQFQGALGASDPDTRHARELAKGNLPRK